MTKKALATVLWNISRFGLGHQAFIRHDLSYDLMFRQMMANTKAELEEELDAKRRRYGSENIDAMIEILGF